MKSVLKQCCLISGIKGSSSIVYVKCEFHSHRILEELCVFVKTGYYPNLFTDKEIDQIVNEISPSVGGKRRFNHTANTFNTFLNQIQEKVHLVISLESALSNEDVAHLLRSHSALYSEFYVDIYKKFNIETINSIARFYLALQIEESKVSKLNKKLNRYVFYDDDSLNANEIKAFSSIMVDLHLIASEQYLNIYESTRKRGPDMKGSSNRMFMPKPFNVSIFKQLAIYFKIYLRRIKEQENIKLKKLERAFSRINEIASQLKNYDNERIELKKKIENLNNLLSAWDEKIAKQKEVFMTSVEECRKEEKLIEEMNKALEVLKHDINRESTSLNFHMSPQYDLALKAIESLNESTFYELKSYRSPPPRLLAVVNTLCLMFRQPPGWDSGKQLLIKPGFYDELVYYDKKNMPDDIYAALEQICSVYSFRPEEIAPISLPGSCLCRWILAVFEFAKLEKTVGAKTKELRDFEDLYNKRLITLGEKRLNSETKCQTLESYCASRINVLKDIKKTELDLEKLSVSETKANELLKLLDEDHRSWISQQNMSNNLLNTCKTDSLMTAAFICYAGIFDSDNRKVLVKKWFSYLDKLNDRLRQESLQSGKSIQGNYSLREHFNIVDILINRYEQNQLLVQLNKIGLKDKYFIENALLLREYCSLPSTSCWPLVYDPDNIAIHVITLMQDSIDQLKGNLLHESINSTSILNLSAPLNAHDTMSIVNESDLSESVKAERGLSIPSAMTSVCDLQSISAVSILNQNNNNANYRNRKSTIQTNMTLSTSEIERVESLPPFSASSSVLSRSTHNITRASTRSGSIWEASSFYSRSQTTATMYRSRSSKTIFNMVEHETPINFPPIETDLNILPKDNLCILDSSDDELDYKLINAASHGLAVFLKNTERMPFQNRLVEILIERDFSYDSNSNREFIQISGDEITINPGFKLILQANTPLSLNYGQKNNHLFQRLVSQFNAAHFVIDFSPSFEYICTDFLITVMNYERPGYSSQIMLADKIIFEAEFNMFNRQVRLLFYLLSFLLYLNRFYLSLKGGNY